MPLRGFTLIEMLVAVALTVLMMTLFASMFQFSTSTMSTQKGVAENDQHVRLVMTLIRDDLNSRTMQDVSPFIPGATTPVNTENASDRRGYLYISEGDPEDDTDDVLAFTVQVTDTSDDRYYGATKLLLPRETSPLTYGTVGSSAPSGTPPPTFPTYPNTGANPPNAIPGRGAPALARSDNYYVYWQNQPEFDDGMIGIVNGAGSSPAAEVRYFLRKGTLYRRINLIRKSSVTGVTDAKPTDGTNDLQTHLIGTGGTPRNFYTYFDYSAFNAAGELRWHAIGDLDNFTASAFPLGDPHYRYGFDLTSGRSLEWMPNAISATPIWWFIGGYTHEETSFMDIGGGGSVQMFGYPGYLNSTASGAVSVNPYAPADPSYATNSGVLTYDPNSGKVTQFTSNGSGANTRTAEDILMTNVIRFDIKVFDEGASYGPDDQPGQGFGPGPDGLMWTADDVQIDDDLNGTMNDATEIGWPGTDDGDFRDLGHNGFIVGGVDRAFYSKTSLYFNNVNNYCQANPIKPGAVLYKFDTWHPAADIDGGGADQPPFRAPEQPAVPTATSPLGRRPLQAIQIRITFLDPTSQQMRDVTHIYSLRQRN